jgi:phospholipid/cholesterol/gamma-HCH transport system permease protein
MRVTEQIDALEGWNNAINYLVFPKFIALISFVISIAMFWVSLVWWACVYGGFSSLDDYITGVQMDLSHIMLFMHL